MEADVWKVVSVMGFSGRDEYMIANTRAGGFVALNCEGGGALHFTVKSEAEAVCDLLNDSDTK
jgi:hypothetical protein